MPEFYARIIDLSKQPGDHGRALTKQIEADNKKEAKYPGNLPLVIGA